MSFHFTQLAQQQGKSASGHARPVLRARWSRCAQTGKLVCNWYLTSAHEPEQGSAELAEVSEQMTFFLQRYQELRAA